ncbi:MAG: zinc-binding alcohol dehydrogenase family protein, partial [Betaproteobacteria bacterium]|nr:zinc-binding alcohol dehydrogenase family protein [Betaproteobacteria bacterium]
MEPISHAEPLARALWVGAKADRIDTLDLRVVAQDIPHLPPGHALIQVHAAAINPSDVKATLG